MRERWEEQAWSWFCESLCVSDVLNQKKYLRGDTHGEDIASLKGLPWTLWKEMVSIGGSGGKRGDLGMEILR